MRLRETLWRMLIAFCVLAGILAAVLAYLATQYEPMIRARLIEAVERRYQSTVQIQSLHVTLFPQLVLRGSGVEMRLRGRTDTPPIVTLKSFTVHAGLRVLFGRPFHMSYVNVEGLRLTLPPKDDPDTAQPETREPSEPGLPLVVDELIADGAFLRVLPKAAGKEPLDFQISKLTLRSVGAGRPMEFRASLTNPKPPGLIESTGHFGPWQSDQPGDSAIEGHYTFTKADLEVFTGISGILSSTGDYRGQLNQISVSGTTDIPDFRVSSSDHKVHLQTKFEATVDGINGDTYLHPVDARFLQTEFICVGKVEHRQGTPGKFIGLNVKTVKGRIDDLLKLAVKGPPALIGNASFNTGFLLPPGRTDVISRLQLNGDFVVDSARFTSGTVEKGLTSLSLRAQGRPKELSQPHSEGLQIASDLRGKFTLAGGQIALDNLSFSVPGAHVTFGGTYGLKNEQINLSGIFQMQAKVSEAFTGWKSTLLRFADPFFEKHGYGIELPIHVGGTRANPSFGVEVFHKQIERETR